MLFNEKYKYYLDIINNYIDNLFEKLKNTNRAPKILLDGMEYAVLGGGKRVRPVLALATAEMLNLSIDKVINFAVAIELIHSYSLVHDDLPAMDNDDYRRGKLSTHKKFGEANGILIGDALLNYAFELCLDCDNLDCNSLSAIKYIANCAGYSGMICGQVLDLINENSTEFNKEKLYEIIENKTGKLISAPIVSVSKIADSIYLDKIEEFAYHLGILFQITDDILDCESNFENLGKTPHKDEEQNKLTAIKVFGLNGAKKQCEFHFNSAINSLKNIPNNDFLIQFTNYIYQRKS